MNQWANSKLLLERSSRSLAGGVSSNVRLGSKPLPLFFERAEGSKIYDVDGNRYVDFVLGQGPLLLGHSHPEVLKAVEKAMKSGQLFAGQHQLEIDVSEALVRLVPCAELCRFSLSGSEAVQAAIRLARAATGRPLILRFEGHYHGWFDNVLVSVSPDLERAGPRTSPAAVLATAGQSESAARECLVLPWNDLPLVEELFQKRGEQIAAVISEPMMCNTGAIEPVSGFLSGLRDVCDRYGALLVLDEVITGFRLGLSGAQGYYGVTPDLATFGKAMAGGFPNSALVGKRQYMELFGRGVNHSGTFNSNVISMAATAAALRQLEAEDGIVYRRLQEVGTALMEGLGEIARKWSVPLRIQGLPMAFHVSFGEGGPVRDYRELVQSRDQQRYAEFVVAMLRKGVRLLERGIWYVSASHTEADVSETLKAAEEVLAA